MEKDPLKIQTYFLLSFLIVQYLLGMAANLFVQFPDTTNEVKQWEFAKTQFLVMAHIVLGLLLLIGGVVFFIRAIRRKDKQWLISASIGLLAILVAIVAGSQFVPTQQDAYSYTMAVAFIVAFASYGWGIFQAKKQ